MVMNVRVMRREKIVMIMEMRRARIMEVVVGMGVVILENLMRELSIPLTKVTKIYYIYKLN